MDLDPGGLLREECTGCDINILELVFIPTVWYKLAARLNDASHGETG